VVPLDVAFDAERGYGLPATSGPAEAGHDRSAAAAPTS
jgi:hypothetical protein